MLLLVLSLIPLALGIVLLAKQPRHSVSFGILETDARGRVDVVDETRIIPFRLDPEFRFGVWFSSFWRWSFRVRLVHYLPAPPAQVGGGLAQVEATDRGYRLEVPEFRCSGNGARSLRFSPGDPLGKYETDVFINGVLHSSFKYTVVESAGRVA